MWVLFNFKCQFTLKYVLKYTCTLKIFSTQYKEEKLFEIINMWNGVWKIIKITSYFFFR